MIRQMKDTGWIEVITGCMYSGKTEELIKRLRRAIIAKQKVKVFKPALDDRYSEKKISSHNKNMLDAIVVMHSDDILSQVEENDEVIGIEEVQFFDEKIIDVCKYLADSGKRVIVAGLDQDYLGQPFENTMRLMAEAEFVTKLLAICVKCGNLANRTQRTVKKKDRIVVGSVGLYEARCRKCFDPELKNEESKG